MIGFRGHFASKSRRYSTTLGAIRGERRAYRQRHAAEQTRELADDEQDTTLIVTHWEFAGSATSPLETPHWPSPPPPEHGNDGKRHVTRHRESSDERREHRGANRRTCELGRYSHRSGTASPRSRRCSALA
jgi:hypothetical protein